MATFADCQMAGNPTCKLRDALAYVDATTPRRLIIDLRRLSFIDSSGLHLIVAIHKQCQRDGTPTLYLRPGPPEVQRTFQLTGLEEVLPFLGLAVRD